MRPLLVLLCLGASLLNNAASAESLRFVAYNVQNYSVSGLPDAPPPKPADSVEKLVALLVSLHPDLLGLIEIAGPSALEDLQARLAAAGWPMPHAILVQAEDSLRQIALLSRLPLEDQSKTHLRFTLDGKYETPGRGLLWATVEVAPEHLWTLVGLHLKSKREVPGRDAAAFRLGEARAIRRELDNAFATNPSLPLILWGDFNEGRNEPALKALQGHRQSPGALHILDLADPLGDRWTHYWKEADQYSRIDFILVSPALRQSVNPDSSGILRPENWEKISDHRPLLVDFHIPE